MAYIDDINEVASLKLPWENLRGKNILVTGATGMLCSSLVEVLMSHKGQNYHVYATGRDETKVKRIFTKYFDNPFFHFFEYDVRNPLNCDIQFHIIIAGASVASPQLYVSDPVSVMKSNLNGVDNLFSYGVKHGLEIFLYVSSSEIYGEGDGQVFTESDSGYVNCATLRACYPSAKRASETLCIAYGYQYGIDVRIIRPCHIYGPHFSDSDKRVYAQFIRNVLANEDIVMKSTGKQYRSWCYVVDCVSAILYILLKGKNGEAYNVADIKSNITIKELAEMIAEIAGKKVIVELPSDIEKLGFNIVTRSVLSTEKLQSLGWYTDSSMKENLVNTIEAIKNEKGDYLN
ncbi:NAD-dependent epimerase/dehydratase family protein [Bacteroides caecigallinarum]|uniref:NAD-dependent epimerase/dehydratase family protein n=1 Tax=Bacteroides caecigallinarum TaxID=1411144 RepID=UPI001F3C8FAC|nr:NAD-dependent epimerase/dehydratase family protein [Bacteroides caecigallinarum]MCF2583432.1 NAD-dependent epimerase/dehydratase family protein [Bacteroides caecigallinarum]